MRKPNIIQVIYCFFLLNKKKIVGVSPSDNADCLCRNRVYVSSEIDFRPFGFYK